MCAEFSAAANLRVQLDDSSVRSARREIEQELASVPIEPEISTNRPTGRQSGRNVFGPRRHKRAWDRNLSLDTERNEILRSIEELLDEDFIGGGGGGGLRARPRGGEGLGGLGGGAVGLAVGGVGIGLLAAANTLSNFEWPTIPEIPDLGIPDDIPDLGLPDIPEIEVAPPPFPIPIPLGEPGGGGASSPSRAELTEQRNEFRQVTDPAGADVGVVDPNQQESGDGFVDDVLVGLGVGGAVGAAGTAVSQGGRFASGLLGGAASGASGFGFPSPINPNVPFLSDQARELLGGGNQTGGVQTALTGTTQTGTQSGSINTAQQRNQGQTVNVTVDNTTNLDPSSMRELEREFDRVKQEVLDEVDRKLSGGGSGRLSAL